MAADVERLKRIAGDFRAKAQDCRRRAYDRRVLDKSLETFRAAAFDDDADAIARIINVRHALIDQVESLLICAKALRGAAHAPADLEATIDGAYAVLKLAFGYA